ncbi:MAG: universal stress protein [Myxococcales bacterium]|nr:universal stress protein [Myxococcales bacterium]
MPETNTMLVAVDLSPEVPPLLEAAIQWATRLGSEMRLLHASDVADPPASGSVPEEVAEAFRVFQERLRDRADEDRAALEQYAATCVGRGVKTSVETVPGRPWEAIIQSSVATPPTLTVVGAHRASEGSTLGRLRDRFLGTTAQRVLRTLSGPILMLTPGEVDFGKPWVVGVDLSDASSLALRTAAHLAGLAGCKLRVVYIHSPVGKVEEESESWRSVLRDHSQRESELELARFLEKHVPADIVAETVVTSGQPGEVLTDDAEQTGAPVLVVGTQGRTRAARFLLGSVAEKCLRLSRTSVLVVPTVDPSE